MTEDSGDLESRVSALETRVGELAQQLQHTKQDAAAARVLAGGADRDVEEMRGEIRDLREEMRGEVRDLRGEMRDFRQATTASFNAMRNDFTDLRTQMNDGFVEIRGRLDATATGLTQITNLLTRLTGDTNDNDASE
ncbi:hypothetical protein ACAG26_23165 [Mycobacterium sp. pUA109]|uniref:hypothetical protein n=1 Tax=Mycobacterium sp. pUA109 TaxID=3238982 RepID=UPI00351B4781